MAEEMSAILTADIHQTENPRDYYRADLLPWINKQARAREVDNLFILGDTTDAKDRHSAHLVNRLHRQLEMICSECNIWILKGNHDFIDPKEPFFMFVDSLPNVNFITEPEQVEIKGMGDVCFLPSTKEWDKEWAKIDFSQFDYIFAHATFEGAVAESGTRLSGIPTSIFAGTKAKIYSGDIHVPQKVGKVEYVGAPYRTRFGDDYDPRIVFIDDAGRASDLHFPCPQKQVVIVKSFGELRKACRDFERGDQVKVRVQFERGNYHEWPKLREDIVSFMQREELELFGPEAILEAAPTRSAEKGSSKRIDPRSLIEAHGKQHKVSKHSLEIGLQPFVGVR